MRRLDVLMRPLLAVLLVLSLAGCSLFDVLDEDTFSTTGRVVRIETDCGGWGLQTKGELYELVKLPEEFRVDGLEVEAKIKRRRDLGSCTMVGPIAEVLEVERR